LGITVIGMLLLRVADPKYKTAAHCKKFSFNPDKALSIMLEYEHAIDQ
jgi:hypothetical protein